jgi:hypothetical protein
MDYAASDVTFGKSCCHDPAAQPTDAMVGVDVYNPIFKRRIKSQADWLSGRKSEIAYRRASASATTEHICSTVEPFIRS